MVTNFATGGPVWVCVGLFSLYHLYLAAGNSTTIEGWEKDKVATLIRRGKIREIKYPYVSSFRSQADDRTLASTATSNPFSAPTPSYGCGRSKCRGTACLIRSTRTPAVSRQCMTGQE